MRILFTGGGTGGHIFPIIAVKEAFENADNIKFYYLGPDSFAKENLAGIKTKFISAGKIRRYFNLEIFFDLIKVFIGIIQSFLYLFLWMPDVIFSKGGYGSFPVVFVGWIYRIPIILHDSDSAPGLANRIMAKFAKKIILSFKTSEEYFTLHHLQNKTKTIPKSTKNGAGFAKYKEKIIVIGNPVRKELLEGNKEKARPALIQRGREIFNISSSKPVLLIIGGSQGAQRINETVVNILPRLLEIAEVIHISGENNFKSVEADVRGFVSESFHLYGFLNADQLKHAYAIADLIVNRAGAGSITEIAAAAKPSIIIPLPNSASDHQRKNAYEFAKNGAAVVLDQENLSPNLFLEAISNLLSNPAKLKEMGEKAKSFYNPKTPELIRDEILKIIRG